MTRMWRRHFLATAGAALAGAAQAGHDALVPVDIPIKRYPGEVAAVGERGGDGRVYSFRTTNLDYRPNEFQSWRLTFVSGELFGQSFQIQENTPSGIVVTSSNGPLDGLAPGDTFLIEQVVVRNIPSRR